MENRKYQLNEFNNENGQKYQPGMWCIVKGYMNYNDEKFHNRANDGWGGLTWYNLKGEKILDLGQVIFYSSYDADIFRTMTSIRYFGAFGSDKVDEYLCRISSKGLDYGEDLFSHLPEEPSEEPSEEEKNINWPDEVCLNIDFIWCSPILLTKPIDNLYMSFNEYNKHRVYDLLFLWTMITGDVFQKRRYGDHISIKKVNKAESRQYQTLHYKTEDGYKPMHEPI